MKINLQSRKFLLMVFSVLLILVGLLSVAYAALSTTLQIMGNAKVSAASWDIYLDNVVLNSSSATSNVPTISNKTTVSFSTTLSKPGDFYEFTIDVVNNGSIDAMIDGVTKTPTLTESQAKYLNYVVEYQNGEVITTRQLVSKNSFVRLKVKVEFRKDITESDLPSTSETLNLAFSVNYVQSDESGTSVPNNGKESLKPTIISGDLQTVGSEVAIGDEHFYIISNTDGEIAMLSKYNLYVGGVYDGSTWTAYGDEATGIQDSTMRGWKSSGKPCNGTAVFSSTNYWYDGFTLKSEYGTSYPTYVYDSNSTLYNYVESYRTYLESQGAEIEEARLIKREELETLGCIGTSCNSAPSWVYGTSYWSGAANSEDRVIGVRSYGAFDYNTFDRDINFGVRPVIVVKI